MENKILINEYKALARKYRPRFFSELIGQEVLIKTLTNAIKSNRVFHAYLLTGIRGVGKTTTARLIARAINCEELKKDQYEPCGVCKSCSSILAEKNLDVIEMDAASRTGVDDVREIIENVKYKPVNSKYKIYIIDEVHMLSKNAFNALLKTLEEPPSHVKFLFATTEVRKLPVTILSRCQRFDLLRINNSALSKHLIDIAKRENILIDNDAIALIVRSSDGSVRDALSLLDQAYINVQEKIIGEHIVKMLGLSDRGRIYDLIDNIFKGEASKSLNIYKSLYEQGGDTIMIFDEMLRIIHFLTEVKILPSKLDDPYIPELEKTRGLEMSKKLTIQILGRFWQVLFKGYQELQNTAHNFQTSEMIIIRLIFLSELPPPAELIKKIETEKNISQNNKFFVKDNHASNISKNTSPTKQKINSYREWVELFHKYREPILYTKLYNQVKLISFEEGKVVINNNLLNDSDFIKTVTKLSLKWTGRIWNISLSDSKTGSTLAEEDIVIKQKKIENIKNDFDIKKIFEIFPGSTIHSIEKIDDIKNEDTEENLESIKEGEK